VIPTLLKLVVKEDMAKLLMGKLDELDHIPPKAYDVIKQLRDTFGGST